MASYGSGIMKNGWSYALSGSKDGPTKATCREHFMMDGLISPPWRNWQDIIPFALTAFGAPTKAGRSAAVVQEMYDLAGTHYYNPNWVTRMEKEKTPLWEIIIFLL